MFFVHGCIFSLGYFAFSALQIYAAVSGFKYWLDTSIFLAIIPSILVFLFPFAPTAVGVMASVDVWGWSWWKALAVFVGPLLLVPISAWLVEESDSF